MKKVYNKLVRDNIPNIIKNNGDIAVTRILEDEEYYLKLKEKLEEEVKEFVTSDDKKELADILEVIYSITKYQKIDINEVEIIRKNKLIKNGGFNNRVLLEYTEDK
jgi:predicted house-cleaning noncanonical NTP pyrophosphatase (MazG superfamily)